MITHHGGAEILEIGDGLAGNFAYGLGEVNAAALYHDIDVVARAPEEAITHITADDKGLYAPLGSNVRNNSEDRLI